jgi:acyl carrier protein
MNAINRNEVRDVLLTTLREFLGDKAPDQITEATDPFKDLGLDSEDGVDFACVLSEKFGCTVPNNVSPLVDDARQCARRVGETIDLMCALIEKERAHE